MRERTVSTLVTLAHFLFPNALQIGGLALFALGLYVLAPWLGITMAGLALCVIGWAVDHGGAK